MKEIKIGLLGIGNVGVGTYKIFQMNREHIEKKTGTRPIITKILARDISKDRGLDLPAGMLTTEVSDILDDPSIDIVVEVLGGIEPATTYMLRAMKNGKHVVTANKAALAASYDVLTRTAKENNVELRFEASVGGAIPILSSIISPLEANTFTEVLGIVNGTTNYILTQMTEKGLPYEDVLKKAQELGFAEADPTADVEGLDAANKLSILIALMFDKYVPPKQIQTKGITQITKAEIEEASAKNSKIKLIAHAKLENGELTYKVSPMVLPNEHPLAGVSNEFNAVYVTGNASGELMFYGRGAGPLPTGSAVAGDIVSIIKNM